MPRKFVRRKIAVKKNKKIAKERIEILWDQVQGSPNSPFVKRWIELALKLSRRWKTDLPKEMKGKYCSSCYSLWIPGKTCFYRIRDGKPVTICKCGKEFKRA